MRSKISVLIFVNLFTAAMLSAQIKVSEDKNYLMTLQGKPFFWMGDTAWELFHRLTREEIVAFLEIRKQQGFNVIQAVALAEFNGIRQANRYGDRPLINEDPEQLAITSGNNFSNPDEYDYWDHVDYAIDQAAERGLYVGLLPTWGDKVAHLWGDGPIIFNEQNAGTYATLLAKRYAKHWNVLWILGGDRPAIYKGNDGKDYDDRLVWRAMANGIEKILGKNAFITYHPSGGERSTSQYIPLESWLDIHAFQSGHGSRETKSWDWVKRDLAMLPKKPTFDMEPCYEDHPVNPWDGKWTRKERGYFTAYDIRARIYRGVFAGGCGVTYGHHHIWQFLNPELYPPVNVGDTLIPWRQAARAEGAEQMRFLKNLMLSRPYFKRISDNSIIVSDPGDSYKDAIIATRDEKGSYAMIYLPNRHPVTINLKRISGTVKNVSWYDPRNGKVIQDKIQNGNAVATFTPPPDGMDWVLVIDDASKNFDIPGKVNGKW